MRDDYRKGNSRFGQRKAAAAPVASLSDGPLLPMPQTHQLPPPSGPPAAAGSSVSAVGASAAAAAAVAAPLDLSLSRHSASSGATRAYDDFKPVALGILTLEDVLEEILQEVRLSRACAQPAPPPAPAQLAVSHAARFCLVVSPRRFTTRATSSRTQQRPRAAARSRAR